jgi:hypothetical protein
MAAWPSTSRARTRGSRASLGIALVMAIMALSPACGAGDALPPEEPTPAAPRCAPIDAYLGDLYALADSGALAGLARVVREAFPDDVRRDFVEALLRLARGLERGSLGAVADAIEALPEEASAGDAEGLQPQLGRVVAWLVEPAPRAEALSLARRVIATCEGGPPLRLLARLLEDGPLVDALVDLLRSEAVAETLRTLSVEGEGGTASGREATAALVRNLLVAATQPSFRVETLTGLLGFVVDLDAPAWAPLVDGLTAALDADGLAAAQGLLACLHRADPDRVLGASLYDLLTSGALRPEGDVATRPASEAEEAVVSALREAAAQVVRALGEDAIARRGLARALGVMLQDTHAGPALSDLARLLAASGLDGLFDLVLDLVSGRCRR